MSVTEILEAMMLSCFPLGCRVRTMVKIDQYQPSEKQLSIMASSISVTLISHPNPSPLSNAGTVRLTLGRCR
ncbi:MAG: hypothetical protein AAFY66_01940, partial [Pseudomonadota bacterium]